MLSVAHDLTDSTARSPGASRGSSSITILLIRWLGWKKKKYIYIACERVCMYYGGSGTSCFFLLSTYSQDFCMTKNTNMSIVSKQYLDL